MGNNLQEMKGIINLKDITDDHFKILFKWRNTKYFIDKSYSKKKVGIKEHRNWFNHIIKRKSYCKIIYFNSLPIGQIRIDKVINKNYLTIYIIKKFSNSGVGSFVVNYCCRDFSLINKKNINIYALIININYSSIEFFLKNGFLLKYKDKIKSEYVYKLNNSELKNLLTYSKSYKRYKYSYKSSQWGSKHSQEIRLKTILNTINDYNKKKNFSVLDIGSGTGDFYKLLSKNKFQFKYEGIDNNHYVIQDLMKKYKSIKLFKINSVYNDYNFKSKYDFIVISGLFSYFNNKTSVYNLLKKMYISANTAVIFNCLLRQKKNKKNNQDLTFEPKSILKQCKLYSKKNILIDNYLPNDFTICMIK